MAFRSLRASFSFASNLAGKSAASFCSSVTRASNLACASLASACSFSTRAFASAWTFLESKSTFCTRAWTPETRVCAASRRVWVALVASVA
ncbi:hypothetical protein EFK50_00250 [Nocardioides marmoriginsengisoli]|uniref:Uncharacterized protein n=1 Tax=Nocardioides marmoriginsengisoli TaxID=661483 RepID=A0A3N0CRJ0_9ACTN|nr:hypothetical protein EFK50_00250 [Nocardioides marmoriginsengisoli]